MISSAKFMKSLTHASRSFYPMGQAWITTKIKILRPTCASIGNYLP